MLPPVSAAPWPARFRPARVGGGQRVQDFIAVLQNVLGKAAIVRALVGVRALSNKDAREFLDLRLLQRGVAVARRVSVSFRKCDAHRFC